MAQSINTKVDMVVKGTSFHGMNNYGNIMVGDKGLNIITDVRSAITSRFHGKKSIT